jgi:hypothetical protein
MAAARVDHSAIGLADGRVLVCGGEDASGAVLGSCELYLPGADAWQPAGTLSQPRARHLALLLRDGTVAVLGGDDGANPTNPLEQFTPATGAWSSPGAEPLGSWLAGAPTPTGRLAFFPGRLNGTAVNDCFMTDPNAALLESCSTPPGGRWGRAVALLPDHGLRGFGGAAPAPSAAAVVIRDGHTVVPALVPSLDARAAVAVPGATLSWSGQRLTRALEGGSGSSSSSAGDAPSVLLQRQDNGAVAVGAVRSFGPSAVTFEVPAGVLPGWYQVTVVVGGAAADAQPLQVKQGPGGPCAADDVCGGGSCTAGTCAAEELPRRPGPLEVRCGCGQGPALAAVLWAALALMRRRRLL